MKTDFFNDLVEQRLLALHTCYLAKVLSVKEVDGEKKNASVQPLARIKAYGESPRAQAVINNVPILTQAKSDVDVGKTVCCICAERDITQTKKGVMATPSLRHHSLSDSIIIGVLEV